MAPTVPAPAAVPRLLVEEAVRAALREDLGRAGDLTSQATIPDRAEATARFVARGAGVVCGLDFAAAAFAALDPAVGFSVVRADATPVGAGDVLAEVGGPARAILGGERVALNFLGHLSGVATATARFVDAVAGTGARICCTRKTTPGLRAFEKYAVRCGGGSNHRYGLDDAILIKDNHVAVAGGVGPAVAMARAHAGHLVRIEVEVDTLEQLRQALDAGPDVVMLDNMAPAMLAEAVAIAGGAVVLEASGGVDLDNVRAIAETGVHYISTGWITHSAPVLDIGLDVVVGG